MAEMLNLIAERRQKNAQLAAARDLAERQYQTEKENKRLDNERADAQLQFSRDQERSTRQQQHDAAGAKLKEEQTARAVAAQPLWTKALNEQNRTEARNIITSAGGTLEPWQLPQSGGAVATATVPYSAGLLDSPVPLPKPELRPTVPLDTSEPAQSGFPARLPDTAHAGISVAPDTMDERANRQAMAGWARRNAAANAPIAAENARRTEDAKHYAEIRMPGVEPQTYSDQAQAQAQAAHGRIGAKAYGELEPGMQTEHETRFYQQERPAVAAGIVTPKEAITQVQRLAGQAEAMAGREANARIMADRADKRIEITSGQRANTALGHDMAAFVSQHNIKQLGVEYSNLEKAAKLANSDQSGAQKAAVDSFITAYKKGTVTTASLHYFADNMSGGMGHLMSLINKAIDGTYGESDINDLAASIAIGTQAVHDDMNDKRETFTTVFYNQEFSEQTGNVDSLYNSTFTPFGFPPIVRRKGSVSAITKTGTRIRAAAGADPTPIRPDDPEKIKKRDALKAELERLGGARPGTTPPRPFGSSPPTGNINGQH